MSLCSRAYKILCMQYRGLLSRQRRAQRDADARPGVYGAFREAGTFGACGGFGESGSGAAIGLEALEPRVLLSGVHYNRVDFLNDAAMGPRRSMWISTAWSQGWV